MPEAVVFPARQLCLEAARKAAICIAAALAIGAALPYSLMFAFVTVTQVGFLVALSEGAISFLAELLGAPEYGFRKIFEAIETLGASALLAAVGLGLQWSLQ